MFAVAGYVYMLESVFFLNQAVMAMFMLCQSHSGGVSLNPYIGNIAQELQFLTEKKPNPIIRLDCHRLRFGKH